MLQLQICAVAHVCICYTLSAAAASWYYFYLMGSGAGGFLKVFVRGLLCSLYNTLFGLGFCPKPTKQPKTNTHTQRAKNIVSIKSF